MDYYYSYGNSVSDEEIKKTQAGVRQILPSLHASNCCLSLAKNNDLVTRNGPQWPLILRGTLLENDVQLYGSSVQQKENSTRYNTHFPIQECETIIHTTPDSLTGDTEDSPELITVRSRVGVEMSRMVEKRWMLAS